MDTQQPDITKQAIINLLAQEINQHPPYKIINTRISTNRYDSRLTIHNNNTHQNHTITISHHTESFVIHIITPDRIQYELYHHQDPNTIKNATKWTLNNLNKQTITQEQQP